MLIGHFILFFPNYEMHLSTPFNKLAE